MSTVHSDLGIPHTMGVVETAGVTGIGLQRADREEDQVPTDTIGILCRSVG